MLQSAIVLILLGMLTPLLPANAQECQASQPGAVDCAAISNTAEIRAAQLQEKLKEVVARGEQPSPEAIADYVAVISALCNDHTPGESCDRYGFSVARPLEHGWKYSYRISLSGMNGDCHYSQKKTDSAGAYLSPAGQEVLQANWSDEKNAYNYTLSAARPLEHCKIDGNNSDSFYRAWVMSPRGLLAIDWPHARASNGANVPLGQWVVPSSGQLVSLQVAPQDSNTLAVRWGEDAELLINDKIEIVGSSFLLPSSWNQFCKTKPASISKRKTSQIPIVRLLPQNVMKLGPEQRP